MGVRKGGTLYAIAGSRLHADTTLRGDIVMELRGGEPVVFLGYERGEGPVKWCKIKVRGKTGYAPEKSLSAKGLGELMKDDGKPIDKRAYPSSGATKA